jgi:hypothetical protein
MNIIIQLKEKIMAICVECKEKLTGKQTRYCSRKCKNLHNNNKHQNYESQQKRGQERKIKLVKEAGGKCKECGYHKNYAALNFHHVNPEEKEFQLCMRKCSNSSLKKLREEAKKCILLCANCHMEHHYPHLMGPAGFEPA